MIFFQRKINLDFSEIVQFNFKNGWENGWKIRNIRNFKKMFKNHAFEKYEKGQKLTTIFFSISFHFQFTVAECSTFFFHSFVVFHFNFRKYNIECVYTPLAVPFYTNNKKSLYAIRFEQTNEAIEVFMLVHASYRFTSAPHSHMCCHDILFNLRLPFQIFLLRSAKFQRNES